MEEGIIGPATDDTKPVPCGGGLLPGLLLEDLPGLEIIEDLQRLEPLGQLPVYLGLEERANEYKKQSRERKFPDHQGAKLAAPFCAVDHLCGLSMHSME
jgi:hypothetical protein